MTDLESALQAGDEGTSRRYGEVRVTIHPSNDSLGVAAAAEAAGILRKAIESRGEASVILATGNSQLSFIERMRTEADVDWSKVTVFHMDEYLGMSGDDRASFRRWMKDKLLDFVEPRTFHGINGDAAAVEQELQRYSALLREKPVTLCVMGIGENGHLAFNDPPADFDTEELVRVVTLDRASRLQQVGEGHFSSLEATPAEAITLTIPALLSAEHVLVLVPELRKAEAVRSAFEGPVQPDCPASILQRTREAHVHLDADSASLLS